MDLKIPTPLQSSASPLLAVILVFELVCRDIGVMDGTGHVTYVGRKAECVRFKHFSDTIYPSTILEVAARDDRVASAKVGHVRLLHCLHFISQTVYKNSHFKTCVAFALNRFSDV